MSKATNPNSTESCPASSHPPPPNSPTHGAGKGRALTGLANESTGATKAKEPFVIRLSHVDIGSRLLRNELAEIDPELDKSRIERDTLSNNLAKLKAHSRSKTDMPPEARNELEDLIEVLTPVLMDGLMKPFR
ncbi:hypothetical protein I7I51_06875 [Histoplasma capsulatum]|uniref:Uncharacterized protein n=1 Tax=Ajellomyces capsulatus TaxID=5037 RepID=A0A8A1MMV4_AJECA|nr:predicted protein [Histoplasma mississippiense (nom. inval.)]EDN06492.1 predicted protein [Histoplasma mississippiense (nom. inval.)]QSS66024.1 hypothetical protein I7I51_06875 [Histoplasma capsulatum]